MDKKTSPKADEPSTMHLSPDASKSQAKGVAKEEVEAREFENITDSSSVENKKRRHVAQI